MFTELDAELRSAHRAAGRSPSTTQQATTVLRLFGQHLESGEHPPDSLDSLTARDVEGFLTAVRERGVSPNTVRTYHLVLKVTFAFAVRRGLMSGNPVSLVEPPRAVRKVRRVLDPSEVDRLVLGRPTGSPFLDARDTAIVALLAGSGLRRSEVCRLLLTDLDMTEGIVVCRGTKTGRDRVVPFDDRTRVAMRRWLRERSRSEVNAAKRGERSEVNALFISRSKKGLAPGAVTQMVRARADAVGLSYERAVHSLRHYAAHTWLSAGISDLNVMTLGGWTSSAMLSVYGAGGRTVRAVEAFRGIGS